MIELSTSDYVAAHGKQPRGYGQWGFCPRQNYATADYLDHVKWFTGKFSDAKKSALAYYRGKVGINVVVVCS